MGVPGLIDSSCYPSLLRSSGFFIRRFPRARGLALGLGRAPLRGSAATDVRRAGLADSSCYLSLLRSSEFYAAIPQGSRTRPGLRSCRRSAAQRATPGGCIRRFPRARGLALGLGRAPLRGSADRRPSGRPQGLVLLSVAAPQLRILCGDSPGLEDSPWA